MWVVSKISGTAAVLGVEAIDLRNFLICFGCMSEELRAIVANLSGWMANYSPPWVAYRALMACYLVFMDKRTGVRPVEIGETLRGALTKLVMRSAGDQANTACGNPQLCAHLEVGIEGATHAVGKRSRERVEKMAGESGYVEEDMGYKAEGWEEDTI